MNLQDELAAPNTGDSTHPDILLNVEGVISPVEFHDVTIVVSSVKQRV